MLFRVTQRSLAGYDSVSIVEHTKLLEMAERLDSPIDYSLWKEAFNSFVWFSAIGDIFAIDNAPWHAERVGRNHWVESVL